MSNFHGLLIQSLNSTAYVLRRPPRAKFAGELNCTNFPRHVIFLRGAENSTCGVWDSSHPPSQPQCPQTDPFLKHTQQGLKDKHGPLRVDPPLLSPFGKYG
ncbi:hypothetical protein AVEN_125161-1 [Araneus ventricosus]|uniref:Uncharacterized protein n=1 Tax=Araneus ventricosus TaxID=182803 RepID=A0A4Y2LU55_ARAVE|nr:hypothetical protein AVEN_125161-1 [Araneus ventricosus]